MQPGRGGGAGGVRAPVLKKQGMILEMKISMLRGGCIACAEHARRAAQRLFRSVFCILQRGGIRRIVPLKPHYGSPMKVSVIVPAYNQARYLPACLDSLWFQDYAQLEIVVVNDGSSDGTAQALEEYAARVAGDQVSFASVYRPEGDVLERAHHARYPALGRELRVITHKANQGLGATLNTGVSAATGAYCTYVPCDDWCMPNMFTELVRALEDTPADFAYADMLVVNDSFQVVRRFNLPEYSFQRSFADWYLCGDAKLYRRELHERFGLYDVSLLAHDHDLFLRFAMGGARFTHVPKALFAKRDHSGAREVDIHSPGNWSRLIGESKKLVGDARAFLAAPGERL